MATPTPLATYLTSKGITQAEFAARCSSLSGLLIRPQVLGRWVNRQSIPNQHSRALIARASGGEVPAESWAGMRARKPPKRAPRKLRRTGS